MSQCIGDGVDENPDPGFSLQRTSPCLNSTPMPMWCRWRSWNFPILVNIVVLKDWQNVPILFEFAGKKWYVPILVLSCNSLLPPPSPKKEKKTSTSEVKSNCEVIIVFAPMHTPLIENMGECGRTDKSS